MDSNSRYRHVNRRKFDLKVHIVLVTKYRKRLFRGEVDGFLKEGIEGVCRSHGWDVVACETDGDHVHIMLAYDATERVCDIVKAVKQETTHALWSEFPELMNVRPRWSYRLETV